jgi:UDP-N-acetylmuramate--alanine ligase
VYIDDYAHHPTELRAAIGAAKALFPGRKITGIFQPHLYTRTRDFLDGFAAALDELDEVLLLDIYPARELPIPGISSERILEKMSNVNKKLLHKTQVINELKKQNVEILLTLGAGDIDTLVEPVRAWLRG